MFKNKRDKQSWRSIRALTGWPGIRRNMMRSMLDFRTFAHENGDPALTVSTLYFPSGYWDSDQKKFELREKKYEQTYIEYLLDGESSV